MQSTKMLDMTRMFIICIMSIYTLYLCFGRLIIDKIKIRSLVKSLGGRVIKTKKIPTGRRLKKRYKVIYQIGDKEIEIFAYYDEIIGKRMRKMRLSSTPPLDL